MGNDMRFIKPLDGLLVRDPDSKQPLSKDGEWKPFVGRAGTYWLRRLIDKTVIEVTEKQKTIDVPVTKKNKEAYKT